VALPGVSDALLRRHCAQKNGEKRLRSLLVRTDEWKDEEQRAKVVRRREQRLPATPAPAEGVRAPLLSAGVRRMSAKRDGSSATLLRARSAAIARARSKRHDKRGAAAEPAFCFPRGVTSQGAALRSS
jgi:hypothetical protein